MAVYFDHKIQSPSVGTHTGIAWHKNHALLAVASKHDPDIAGSINLYLDEGEHEEESSIQRSSFVSSFSWHPVRKILANGWENGELLIWNDHDHDLFEVHSVHKSVVKVLQWSNNGSRLVSGDENGVLAVWKIDTKGRTQQTPLYQHNVHSAVIQCVFKPAHVPDSTNETSSLAKAAVNGDEAALDMFMWRKTNNKMSTSSNTENSFFCGTIEGKVFFVDDKGRCIQSFVTDGPIKSLLYHEGKDVLVAITNGLILSQHGVAQDGVTTEIMKVKLSGQPTRSEIIWAGRDLLAIASGESSIRMLDLSRNDNFVLTLDKGGFDPGECINCLAYSKTSGQIAAGTNKGKVTMWKRRMLRQTSKNKDKQEKWEIQPPCVLEGEKDLIQIQWGGGRNLLAVNSMSTVTILNEQIMNAHYSSGVAGVQVSSSQLVIENFNTSFQQDLKTDVHIKGVYMTKGHTTVWNGKRVVVYEVSPDKAMVRAEGSFASSSQVVVVHEQNVYTAEPGKIQVRTFQGTMKQVLSFSETEGDPVVLDVCGNYLIAGSSLGYIKLWDLSRREAKQHCKPKCLEESIPGIGKLLSVKINCNGSKVSILCDKANQTIDTKIHIWDVEQDTVHSFDFATGRRSSVDEDEESDAKTQSLEIKGRKAVTQFWDPLEPKLLVCETVLLPGGASEHSTDTVSKKPLPSGATAVDNEQIETAVLVISLFVTPENGVLFKDYLSIDSSQNRFMGVQVPFFFFMKKGISMDENSTSSGLSFGKAAPTSSRSVVTKHTMRDFTGLENSSEETKKAMMDFSYLSTIGNMDEAFKAIKLIKSESVWENMARMCVKTKRLDVATVCLGNMGNARAAKSLRHAMLEPELDAKVAMLAVELGMLDEAERLYKNCGRFDLLNKLYQASNKWTKAIETAELQDRINLRTTYYNYAKHLEVTGNFSAAITNYEKSDTHRFEVPRMLLDDAPQLEAYILKTKDRELRKWWAQYMESTSEMETALHFYESARDNLSLVRVYCYCGNLDKAAEICNETGDRAASYHLARQYENQDNIKDAIHFYTRAQCYSNAIRLAKEHGLDNELMNLALLSHSADMIDVARYYENQPNMQDKAVMLYHKGGNISKALDLCFSTEQFAALQVIAEDLDEETDPAMLEKCADFFMEHGQYDKAVELLVAGKKFSEAMEVCMAHNVTITESLAEKMTMPKDTDQPEYRIKLLEKIAECCLQQGSYHLATKKFTQAGNKAKAMKALLKSGDTEKIVFFAGVSRQKEIYVMAANYLQSLDWRKDPEIMKNIIGFYTKGRALDSLAGFYDACAQVEIDEYQNYDKALGALTEAYKCMAKAKTKNSEIQEDKVAFLKQRIGFVKKFVNARRSYEEDPDESVRSFQVLLEEPDLETAVRVGDVYGFLIEHFARQQNYSKAYSLIEELRSRLPSLNLAYYINMKTIEAIHKSVGVPLGRGLGGKIKEGLDIDDGDEVEEEVEEDIYNGHDY